MFKYNKKNILSIFILATTLIVVQMPSYAAYDIVKAKTIRSNVTINPGYKMYEDDVFSSVHYDDFDEDVVEEIKETPFEKKLKTIFKKKKKKTSDIEDETVQEDVVETSEDSKIDNKAEEKQQENKEEKTKQQTDNDISDEEVSQNDEQQKEVSVEVEEFLPEKVKFYENIEVDEKFKFKINADKMTYNDEDGNVYAQGNVEIIAKEQKVIIKADELILDKAAQVLKLNGNVRVIKEMTEMQGESIVIDLNEQNILMDNPTMYAYSFVVKAQEGYLIANDIQMLNGTLKGAKNKDFPLVTKGFMGFDAVSRSSFFGKSQYATVNDADKDVRQSYRIDSKEIVITCLKDHNSVLLKDSDVYYNNHKIVNGMDIEIIRDKDNQLTEVNAPEAGNLRGFGSYAGYGKVFKLPEGQTLKLMPVLTYFKSDIGVGLIGRYRTPRGTLDGGWNTASENLVLRGRYKLTNSVNLTYGRHAYMPEGFMGARRSGYAAQLQYMKSYRIRDLGAMFSNTVQAGLFSDYAKKDQEDAFSTTRFRYMAQLSKTMFTYRNEEQDFAMALGAVTQGAATVYGTGHTHGIIRIGPTISTRFKRWDSTVGYFLTGLHGDTPFKFDRYRYGKSTIQINERFNVNDKLAFGFRLFITPMKDNPQKDLLTECRFYVVAGPSDMKVALSYDFVRDIAHLNFMFLIGTDNSSINFDKLSTKDIDGNTRKQDFYRSAKPVKIINPESI